jgi:hypothetical protein
MSEYIGTTFEVGGPISVKDLKGFLEILKDEVSEITGPLTLAEFRSAVKKGSVLNRALGGVKWYGTSNYGLCDNLEEFCKEHTISFIRTCEGKYEYNGTTSYWLPGMKEIVEIESDQDVEPVVKINEIRPICDLLLALTRMGPKALMTFVGVKEVKDLVEKGLRKPAKALALIEERIHELLPVVPTLPPVTIKGDDLK